MNLEDFISKKSAYLLLEDGTIYNGYQLGKSGVSGGEVIFNTSHTGYQEILTDPSYKGQIVLMCYPHIGNYGINDDDLESSRLHLSGMIVRESSLIESNYRSKKSLDSYLKLNNIVGIEGIDTRALTKRIRLNGSMRGLIVSSDDIDLSKAKSLLKEVKGTQNQDLVKEVTPKESYDWELGGIWSESRYNDSNEEYKFRVAVIDFGGKRTIYRYLDDLGAKLKIFRADSSYKEIESYNPDGIFLSNGPGDPAALGYIVENIKVLIGRYPIFGICLGHQLIAMALGGTRYKLKFGHHGVNQPVKDMKSNKILITSQNHNYAISESSLPSSLFVRYKNLNDGSVEGIEKEDDNIFSVQFHPESSPGPSEAKELFKRFHKMLIVNSVTKLSKSEIK